MNPSGRARRYVIAAAAAALLWSVPARSLGAQAVVRGTVVDDETRQPITTAELRLIDAEGEMRAQSLSNAQGQFRMEVPVGIYSLAVSRVGYASIDASDIQVEQDGELELQVRLATQAVVLEPVAVVVQRRTEWGRLAEHLERAERNRLMGRGRIYLRDDIERMRPISVNVLIDPYFWVAQCTPHIYLNGMPTDDSLFGVSPHQIEGLELYRDRDPIPPEYYRSGMCGLALLWTRAEYRPWSWRRAAVAGALITLFVLLLR